MNQRFFERGRNGCGAGRQVLENAVFTVGFLAGSGVFLASFLRLPSVSTFCGVWGVNCAWGIGGEEGGDPAGGDLWVTGAAWDSVRCGQIG